jgi:hypothetical protein
MRRRRKVWTAVAVVAVAGVVAGLALFQPWKLWVDETVDEAPPVVVAPSAAVATGSPSTPAAATGSPSAGPALLAQGAFVSHEHATSGAVQLVRAPDGSRYLRLENLDTSNGPLLQVWLTDAPVRAGKDGWYVFDDGRHVDLGPLKGNKGSQNYPVPADVDLAQYRSVSVWCARFHVSFGAAELNPP